MPILRRYNVAPALGPAALARASKRSDLMGDLGRPKGRQRAPSKGPRSPHDVCMNEMGKVLPRPTPRRQQLPQGERVRTPPPLRGALRDATGQDKPRLQAEHMNRSTRVRRYDVLSQKGRVGGSLTMRWRQAEAQSKCRQTVRSKVARTIELESISRTAARD